MNISVRRRIRVNGKEYSSPEEMPPDVRAAYEKAMAPGSPSLSHALDNIVVNGRILSGGSREKLYDDIMRVIENNGEVTLPASAHPLLTPRQIKVVVAVAAAIVLGAAAFVAKTIG